MIAMWVGKGLSDLGRTLPANNGAMGVGSLIRMVDDYTGWIDLFVRTTDMISDACLALFLAGGLMNLKLWELTGIALRLLVNPALQVVLVVLFRIPVFRCMGRGYGAARVSGGAPGWGVLHRLHQHPDHHRLYQFVAVTTVHTRAARQALARRLARPVRAYFRATREARS